MKFILNDLAIETTRRCNMKCEHCMRGLSQNIDITPALIDMIFDNAEIASIEHICFSGGEPTLNPNIIIYTINKIINESLDVAEIAMVTNGQIFNKDLADAFNRFNDYRNQKTKEQLKMHYSKLGEEILDGLIQANTNSHVRITFSNDRFHYPIRQEVKDNYKKMCKGARITEYAVDDKDIYKTGFANTGKNFDYKLDQINYCKDGDFYFVIGNIYITATGYMTSEGMGEYNDMDRLNMGHISDTTLQEALSKYGNPVFNTPKIDYNELDERSKKKRV